MDETVLNHVHKDLEHFLNAKPLYYDEIDYTRMPRIYNTISSYLKIPSVIHLVGTNGKGTTGRFLANALHQSGARVGHYTSPHILKFNERIWKNGADVTDAVLEEAHQHLLALLTDEDAEALSYFEYTTLLAMCVYVDVDYVVLEAGLGGEHDATNVFDKTLSIFTPISFDHQAFLGDDLSSIARTKMRSMQKRALLGEQKESEVIRIFESILKEKEAIGYHIKDILGKDDIILVEVITKNLELPDYLSQNLATAVGAMRLLEIEPKLEYFQKPQLFGRLSSFKKNITVDVGHNVLAAEAIAKAFYSKKVILVYNSYKDKDYEEILSALCTIIDHVQIIKVDDVRVESEKLLKATLKRLNLKYCDFNGVDESKEYLVFGSFSVVEAFINQYE